MTLLKEKGSAVEDNGREPQLKRSIMSTALCTLALFGLMTGAVLSGAPQYALAQDENVQPSETNDASTSEELGDALEKAGGSYEVSTADELAQAFTDIAASDETVATIVLTANINNSSNKVVGVEGKRVTFQSADGARYSLYATSLAGDCIFDTVDLSNDDIAAMGHYLELTENFTDKLGSIYGGKARTTKHTMFDSCELVLCGGSSDEVFGVGANCGTTGDVVLTIDGHESGTVTGGSQLSMSSDDSIAGCHIGGDVTVNFISGAAEKLYGGSQGDKPGVRSKVTYAKIDGSVTLNIGEQGSGEDTALVGEVYGAGVACECPNVTVNVYDGAHTGYPDPDWFLTNGWLLSGGLLCNIEQKVTTNVHGGEVGLFVAGSAGVYQAGSWPGSYPSFIGDPSNNSPSSNMPTVVEVYLTGGYVNTVNLFSAEENMPLNENISHIYGNVYMEMTGGRIASIRMSRMYNVVCGDVAVRIKAGRGSGTQAIRGDELGQARCR